MSENIVIDSNINRWLNAFEAFNRGEVPFCPICHNAELEIIARMGSDRIGSLAMTCPRCKLTGYFCRVEFSNKANVELF